jgi:hypothetical protein
MTDAASTSLAKSPLRHAMTAMSIWAAYTLIAVVLLHPLVSRLSSHIMADDVFIQPGRSDAYNFLWTYWWIQKAVLSSKNSYHCSWVYPPTGANLYFHTHVILPTLLTLPLGMLLGPVAGYNSMIVLLLSGAASVYYGFLRRTFELSRSASFVTGALFGFCPFFVFKTHAHVNLVGGAFWGAALAVLVHAYARNQFGWRSGLLFSLCLWATFWTSFVEFFELLVICAVVVATFELQRVVSRGSAPRRGRLAFFAMSLPGALSLVSLLNAPNAKAVDIALFPNLQLTDLLIPARLSFWGGLFRVSAWEYWGSHIPIVFVVLSVVGIAAAVGGGALARPLRALLAIATLTLIFTLNPLDIPSTLIRRLPMGTGFRVFGRFLPFFYFFLLIFAALGAERLLRLRNRGLRVATCATLTLLACAEMFPWQLSPSVVKDFKVPAAVLADAERGAFTLIVPAGSYSNVLDTYQVSMNVPVVQLSYLAREDPQSVAARAQRFPALYGNAHKLSARLRAQMLDAHVHYVLYEDGRQYSATILGGEPVAEHAGAILVRYYPPFTTPAP